MKMTLPHRLRRNRKTESVRSLVRETHLHAADLVAPFFVRAGRNEREPILSLPGIERLSIDLVIREARALQDQGIQAIALFPIIPLEQKTPGAEEAWNPSGLLQEAIREVKRALPSLSIITDVALDPYTSHGHDGLASPYGEILNDPTIECLSKMALVQAEAGADFVAPSDMMDGRVGAIRSALDEAGFVNTGILAYSVKYASSLYGPFRDAVRSNLQFGDKKTYQMDPANAREALLEARLDEEEGADILMVKPATFYLDIIAKLREESRRPIAAYHVSGEYAMVMAAHEKGYLNAEKVMHEALLSIKRAGADLIFTYATSMMCKAALLD
jgi:porphobilinogen synthase